MGKHKQDDGIDCRVEPVEGAPISLQKVVDSTNSETGVSKELRVIVNNTGLGIVNDTADFMNVTAEDRLQQADYFLSLNLPMPPYLKKYIDLMYKGDPSAEVLYKYAKTNDELKQIIGFIQLVGGALNIGRKNKACIKLYIVEPETKLHPKRQAVVMSLFETLKKDYGFKPETNESTGKDTSNT